MEIKNKSRAGSFLGSETEVESCNSYSLNGEDLRYSIRTSLSSSDSPPKNSFRFPPPPFFVPSPRNCTNNVYEHGESDNSLTTGSASDIEDNSDSQSDAACSRVVPGSEHGSHYPPKTQKESGSQSDTGFGGVSGSSNVRLRSSPLPIYRPVHSIRGYESDGSPAGIRPQTQLLPPIGVFWDIENCQVPKGRSAVAIAQLIRERFFEGRREAEFLVVCDVKKENSQIISELNDAQVNLIHVSATCKNAADEKLRQSIRRFAEIYGSPAAIILISGDVNFAADLIDLRHRKKIHVILIHNSNTSETLILCANEHYNFSSLVENLPLRGAFKSGNQPVEVIVSNLPSDKDLGKVKNRLRKLSDNCGGRVGQIVHDRAIIRFPTKEFASRAQRRMDGQDVLGNKILVSRPQRVFVKDQESPQKLQLDRNRVRKVTQHLEDLKISNLPSPEESSFLNRASLSSLPQSCSHGMYLSKGYGNSAKSEVSSNSLVSASLASAPFSASLATASSTTATSASLPPFNICQTGIGTASFYRNTPPPRILLGSVSSSIPGQSSQSQSLTQSLLNGWSQGNVPGASGVPHSQSTETLSTSYTKATQSTQQQKQYQLSLQLWQGASSNLNASTSPPSLQMASQTLSQIATSLPNSGTGDFTPDLWKHLSELPKVQAENLSWEDASSNHQAMHVSPLRGCVAPQTRSPSPSTLSSISAQIHAPLGHLKTGAGDGVQISQVGPNASGTVVKSRTPSPYGLSVDQIYQSQGNRCLWGSTAKISPVLDTKEPERYFNPIHSSQSRQSSQGSHGPVELQVTNLDQNMDPKEMKRVLQAVFREHVSVLHVSVFVQSDGNLASTVRVSSLQDAQYAISQLHRKKVGFKRIQISYSQNGPSINPALVRSQIVSLLQDVPGHRLPLFKFREMFENRYLSTISVSDMYKLRDVCLVSEEPNGRMVTLNPQHRNTPSPLLAGSSQDGPSAMELPYCPQHYQNSNTHNKGWAEQELATLPNVNIGLTLFSQRVHNLVQSHNGSLPLPSFAHCYDAQYGPLEIEDNGVPLEHLISCVSGVELYQGVGCVKYLRWASGGDSETANDTDGSSIVSNVSPPLAGPLALFSRELVDLLKTAPNCQISFNRFIPAYHHHFGRQCRVADYGYTKLMPLLEALPNIVQVLGEGNKRMVTLSHRAQVRRFTSDLLRVLKAQYSKQVTLSEFPAAYQRILNRPFEVVNYGVCRVEDVLAEVAETTVLVSPTNTNDILIAIPKREQTQEEMEKTKQFASEVLQLLRYAPQCSMDFSKFIPYYHHHFGKQCRVSDYGFSKLIELFEAIPDIVKVTDGEEGERRVQLTLEQRLRVLGDIVGVIVQEYGHSYMPISAVSENFLLTSGYALRPEDYGFNSLEELFGAIQFSVKLHVTPSGTYVGLVDQDHLHFLSLSVRCILWAQKDCQMSASDFQDYYSQIIGGKCNFDDLQRELKDFIEVAQDSHGAVQYVSLKPLQILARNIQHLLQESDGRILLSMFETSYIQRFGTAIQPAQYGFSSVPTMLQALQDIFSIKGKGPRRILVLQNSSIENILNLLECTKSEAVLESIEFSSPKKATNALSDVKNVLESPDTVLKKLIRNLSNQASPAKQRMYAERSPGGQQGYRPLGFATSQQPLHSNSNHHFAWGPPHPTNSGHASFTVPIAIPDCPLQSPSSLLSGFNGIEGTSPPSPRASLPIVQPPDPSELPMPRMSLTSPTVSCNVNSVGTLNGAVVDYHDVTTVGTLANLNSSIAEETIESPQSGLLNSSQEGTQSTGRSKRKQRLAIQFTSPIVPIQ